MKGKARLTEEWEQYIREVARDRGKELNTLKTTAQDRELHRKWINDLKQKTTVEGGEEENNCEKTGTEFMEPHENKQVAT